MILATFQVPGPVILFGAITGMTYGILAVGLVLVYRSSRVINFAQGAIGALGASLLGVLVVKGHVPYWIAFLGGMLLAAATGGLSEVVIVRRLRNAPQLMTLVATLGLAEFILSFSLLINGQVAAGTSFPSPAFFPTFNVGALTVTPAYSAMLFLTPVVVIALTIFLRKTRLGLAIRASADQRDAARLAGVSAGRMSVLVWCIAGGVAAYTVSLVLPTVGYANNDFFGPELLLRALTAAVIARMTSLPIALVAGVAIGIVQEVVLWNYSSGGQFEAVLFVIILVALLLQRRRFGRTVDTGNWAAVQPWRHPPDSFQRIWSIRNLPWITAGVVLAVAIVLPIMITAASTYIFVLMMSFGLVGLSVGIVTGLAGQLSLGQFAFAGVGAAASYYATRSSGNFVLGFLCAGLVAAAVSLVIGLPALRIRGVMLAVITLAFALATSYFFFSQSWMFGGNGVQPKTPSIGGFEFDTAKRYYYLALAVLLLGLLLCRNIWRGGVGLKLKAQRDNEDGARSFSVRPTAMKLQGFLLAGFLAGIGGALYAHSLSNVGSDAFSVQSSIDVTAMTVLGGIGLIAGPLLGVLYIVGIPQFLPLDSAGTAATALGWLFIILYFPGGIAHMIQPLRDQLINALARRKGLDPEVEWAAMSPATATADFSASPTFLRAPIDGDRGQPGVPALRVQHLRRTYGGVVAVDDISFDVQPGETIGLIGPNGAGKTTLLEMISGFVRSEGGEVWFEGRNVTSLEAARRAEVGLVRSFQDARLFPTLTVLESVALALERITPTRFVPSVLGFHAPERRKQERAMELISLLGLSAWRHVEVQHLSTGTRRVAELACLVALRPSVLLLDEPSSGIAERETEALGKLLLQLKNYLSMTMIVVEHDVPMITGMADRMIAMDGGQIIAFDTPESVTRNPAVQESTWEPTPPLSLAPES